MSTTSVAAKFSWISRGRTKTCGSGAASRLLDAYQVIIGQVRKLARRAAELGDDGTDDLIVSEVLRRNELQVWFLSEHLVDASLVTGTNNQSISAHIRLTKALKFIAMPRRNHFRSS